MTVTQVMSELKALGSEQTAKTYRRHGAAGELFGVKFGDLGKLAKRIKTDHALAQELWATGNVDARMLAAMIADPAQMTDADVERWLQGIKYHGLIDAVVNHVVAVMPIAPRLAAHWTDSPDEWTGRAGWQLVSQLAMQPNGFPDKFFHVFLETIVRGIHTRPNRTREAMNLALIAIGVRNAALEAQALSVAAMIGKVDVDHGDTACKTPDAAAYIRKTVAYRKSKAKAGNA